MKEKMHNTYFKSIKFSLILVSCVTIFNTITAGEAASDQVMGKLNQERDELTRFFQIAKSGYSNHRVFARGYYSDYLPPEPDDRGLEELIATLKCESKASGAAKIC